MLLMGIVFVEATPRADCDRNKHDTEFYCVGAGERRPFVSGARAKPFRGYRSGVFCSKKRAHASRRTVGKDTMAARGASETPRARFLENK